MSVYILSFCSVCIFYSLPPIYSIPNIQTIWHFDDVLILIRMTYVRVEIATTSEWCFFLIAMAIDKNSKLLFNCVDNIVRFWDREPGEGCALIHILSKQRHFSGVPQKISTQNTRSKSINIEASFPISND